MQRPGSVIHPVADFRGCSRDDGCRRRLFILALRVLGRAVSGIRPRLPDPSRIDKCRLTGAAANYM